MSKQPTHETQQKHFEVDVRNISPLERAGGNIRTDYGDLEELAKSIAENGVLMPLRAYRSEEDPEKWIAIDGHRRLAASMMLVKDKKMDVRVKIIVVDRRKLTDEQLIYDMVITNEGKPLNPVELAEAVRRLLALGHKQKDIASRMGKPNYFISNLANFATAPKRIRDMVSNGQISFSTVLSTMRQEGDFNKVLEAIEKAGEISKSSPAIKGTITGNLKITKQHINDATNKIDSFKELLSVVNSQESNPKEVKNLELYQFLRKMTKNQLTKSDIQNFLF